MKKTLLVALMIVGVVASVWAAATPEKNGKELTTVRIGIHANEGGAPLAAVAQEQGFFEKHGIKVNFTVVESGPAEMTAMRADNRTLDIGYIGAGVAWNPIDGNGNGLSFVFLDCLSNAEMFIAKKGLFIDANANGRFDFDEIYTGLKGKKVYIEVGTTPGGWFKALLELINAGRPAAEQLWIHSETSSYMAGYTAPNSNVANRIEVINTLNSNLPAGMASNGGMDVVVGFSPATSTILKTNKNAELIATTVSHFPPEKSFPSTWVASNAWLKESPEVAQAFINALYEAAIWRAENIDEAMRAGERISQKPVGSFDPTNLVAPTKAMYQQWFASKDSLGYQYMKALYQVRVPNVPAGNKVKSFEESFDDSYLLNALKSF
ncbi:MAG: ABC transporter substrate-binding protein [Sphaerochaeta sp.]|jgi:NitT/TauT family transport system substrate-binding protein|uniref:ABC transporter substrate-binding protein n=1 Tax=Sphaerochaeta sp. TaxID=1972642 RepID=UPI002A360266|nr:ABC transporter substrate-binding protein [Sphaerochaeta sp.]MDX9824859.1 ABC transporter substrate-binding protein [Sphaerochaeta sp.]